jgi:biopolymer transport protein ExbD
MKFPRNSKLLRSPFETAPFAAVFFLLTMFLLLGALLPTPGLPLQLPFAAQLPGTDKPTAFLAVDAAGRYFFANQLVDGAKLERDLRGAAVRSPGPLTLVINADRRVTYGQLVEITLLARRAGITNAILATRPEDRGESSARP